MPNKQLEHELNLKINELNESLRIQDLLVETLENSNKRLGEMESVLKSIAEKYNFQANILMRWSRKTGDLNHHAASGCNGR
jgi:hypothetical protein